MQSDYIMRIIEQFMQAIVAIAQRRKAGNYQEALVHISNSRQAIFTRRK
jgi:hypothetical protein